MTPAEWLAREIAGARIPAKPDAEPLTIAAQMIWAHGPADRVHKRRKAREVSRR